MSRWLPWGDRGKVAVLAVCLLVLAVVCGREAWLFYETRRFHDIVADLEASGEPTSEYDAVRRPVAEPDDPDSRNAARYYSAAAELLVNPFERSRATLAALTAAREGELPDQETRRDLGAFVAANEEPLELVARTRTLAFGGFRLPRPFRYTSVYSLTDLLDAAAVTRVIEGDGDAALALAGDLLALFRTDSDNRTASLSQRQLLEQVALLASITLTHARPSTEAIAACERTAQALADADSLPGAVRLTRASFMDEVWRHIRTGRALTADSDLVEFALRPWHRRRANALLSRMSAVVAAAERPWPARLAEIGRIAARVREPDSQPGPRGPLEQFERMFDLGIYADLALGAAHQATILPALRAILAVELHRRATGVLPTTLEDLDDPTRFIDPLTSEPLRLVREDDAYVVYGVGANGLDDGGDLGMVGPHSVSWWIMPEDAPDWGVRVRLPADDVAPSPAAAPPPDD